MRAVVTRRGQLVVDEIDEPTPGDGHVVTRPLMAGICGSDIHALADFAHFATLAHEQGVTRLNADADTVFGHEFCAEIIEHGPQCEETLPVGTRVCSVPILFAPSGIEQIGYSNSYPGAMAERMILQEMMLLPVPDNVTNATAALTEPLAVGEHAVGLSGLEAGQPSLVVGCGPVGLAVIAALRARGLGPILAADFSPTRRRLAEAFGADEVIDPAEENPHDRWDAMGIARTSMERAIASTMGVAKIPPVIFEAVGVPGMIKSLIHDAPASSRIVVVGVCMHSDTFEPFTAITKEIELRFSFGYNGTEFAATLERLGRGVPGTEHLVTLVTDFDGAAGAFATLGSPGEHGKILIHP